MSEAITLRSVTKTYTRGGESLCVLDGLDLVMDGGTFYALMGPSGSGKTTLLNLIGGLDHADGGDVLVGDTDLNALDGGALAAWRAANVGFVFQFYNLLPMLSAQKNVELPLLLTKLSAAQRKKNASVIFATQSLADIESSAIAPAIIESCPTRIFLPNERAAEPQIARVYERFGLNHRQIEILSRATPKRDYYCQSRRGNRLFDLGLGDIALAFSAASSKSDQIRIGELIAAHGQQQFAAAWLRHRGLTWAADLLGNLEIQ